MSLNNSKIRNLKPSLKPFKVSDSRGLYLLVNPCGSRLWYLKYRINGKEFRLGLGAYPDVSLSGERQQRDGIRKLLTQNINPVKQRAAERRACTSQKVRGTKTGVLTIWFTPFIRPIYRGPNERGNVMARTAYRHEMQQSYLGVESAINYYSKLKKINSKNIL